MFAYSGGIDIGVPLGPGIKCIPFMAYISSSLRGISACIGEYAAPDPKSRGSIIMWLTGGLKVAPDHKG